MSLYGTGGETKLPCDKENSFGKLWFIDWRAAKKLETATAS